jgi:hypothetical protein
MNRMGPDTTPLINLVRNCVESGRAEAWEASIADLQPMFARVAFRAASHDLDDAIQEIGMKLGANRREFLRRLPLHLR